MKKLGTFLVYVLSFLLVMLSFGLSALGFKEWGVDIWLVFLFSYGFVFLSIYLILVLHELGHAFCGYLTGYRLVALGLGPLIWTKKAGRFHFSRTVVLKNVGAQYVGVKDDERDQRSRLMLSGGLLVHLTLILLAVFLGILTDSWLLTGVWIALNLSMLVVNAWPVGITDGAKIWELRKYPENVPFFFLGMRHSAQTLLAPDEHDLKEFTMAVPEGAQGSFVDNVRIQQGEVFLLEGRLEEAKAAFQSLLDKTDHSVSQTLSQIYLLQIALLEGDHEKAEEYASIRGVKSFLSLKSADMQLIQAWYQFKVKKDVVQTRKAIKIARQKMNSSRMLRDEKRYYENWLAELEKELDKGV